MILPGGEKRVVRYERHCVALGGAYTLLQRFLFDVEFVGDDIMCSRYKPTTY